jgi:hypothetical protein
MLITHVLFHNGTTRPRVADGSRHPQIRTVAQNKSQTFDKGRRSNLNVGSGANNVSSHKKSYKISDLIKREEFLEGVGRLLQYHETEEMRKISNFSQNLNISHTHFGTVYNIGCNNFSPPPKKKKYQRAGESGTANFVTRMTVETEGNLIHSRFLHVEREGPTPKYVS